MIPKFISSRLIRLLLIVCVVFLVVASVAAFLVRRKLAVPNFTRPSDVIFLPQNWTAAQRERFYHTAQGSLILPYRWFLALDNLVGRLVIVFFVIIPTSKVLALFQTRRVIKILMGFRSGLRETSA